MVALFENELKKGTGVPLLLLKNGVIVASDQIDEIIINCIITTDYYDAQVDGTRGNYLYEVVSNYSRKEKIYAKIIESFEEMEEDDFSEEQIAGFVSNLVKINVYPLEKYYEKIDWYMEKYREHYIMPGLDELIEIDGMNAIKHYTKLLGKLVNDGDEHHLSVCFFEDNDQYTEEEIKSILKNENDDDINKYLNFIENNKDEGFPKSKRLTFKELKKKKPRTLYGWVSKATEDEIKQLSKLYLRTRDIDFKRRILLAFSEKRIMIDEKHLWKELKRTKDLNYKSAIITALGCFDNPAAKNLIDRYWKHEETRLAALEVYIKFIEEADEGKLDRYLGELDANNAHHIIDAVTEYEKIRTMSFYHKILRKVYEKNMWCGYCREKIIKEMVRINCLDENLLGEIQYDCQKQIRSIANEYKNSQK